MQAERAPFVGIVLALMIVAIETMGLIAYARAPEPQASASVGKAQTWSEAQVRPIKVRCRR